MVCCPAATGVSIDRIAMEQVNQRVEERFAALIAVPEPARNSASGSGEARIRGNCGETLVIIK